MEATVLYLMRHAQAGPGGLLIGQADYPLSLQGEVEAAGWRDFFRRHPVQAAWTSPLLRARRTAALALGEDGPEPVICPELIEVSLGRWEGLSSRQVRQEFPREWELRGQNPAGYAPPGGESYVDLAGRVLPVFTALRRQAQGLRSALLVAHRSVNQVILAAMESLPLERAPYIPQPYARCTVLELRASSVRIVERELSAPQPG